VSAKTGEGLDELRAALARVPIDERDSSSPTRLWVDRAFSLAGAGTIATGTLWSGTIAPGDLLRVEPRGRTARVRTVQVHDAQVDEAAAGQRVAVNLPTLRRGDVARGDALVEPNAFPVSYRLDVRLEELERVPPAVTVHIGTKATAARVARAGPYAQLRLSEPVVAARGDRVILRTDTTVAGGVVLDPVPPRRLERDRLETLERGDPIEIVRTLVHAPVTGRELEARGLLTPRELAQGLATMRSAGDYYFSPEWLDGLRAGVRNRLAEHAAAHPLDPGVALAELLPADPWAPYVLNLLDVERRDAKAYLPGAAAALGSRASAAAALEAELAEDEVVRVEDRELAAFLEQEGRLRRVGDGLAVSAALYDRGRDLLPGLGEITLPGFRDALGVGRRTAQLLLERYDADGLTRRRGDVRVLRRSRNQ
jgi:selenocysteine-specific elongation factor